MMSAYLVLYGAGAGHVLMAFSVFAGCAANVLFEHSYKMLIAVEAAVICYRLDTFI